MLAQLVRKGLYFSDGWKRLFRLLLFLLLDFVCCLRVQIRLCVVGFLGASIVVLLRCYFFQHRLAAVCAENLFRLEYNASPFMFFMAFLVNLALALGAVPSCRSDHAKIQAAALTVLFFQCDHSLSVWLLCYAVQNTG